MLERHYDRAAQDIGNIVNIGHVNVCITDQHVATHYYVSGLGLTRDPFPQYRRGQYVDQCRHEPISSADGKA